MTKTNRFRPSVESLDQRALLSMTLSGGLLEVVGSTGNDNVRVSMASPTSVRVTLDSTGESVTHKLADLKSILIRVRAGNDTVTVDPNVLLPTEVRGWAGDDVILGGGGNDTLLGGGGADKIDGRGGDDSIRGQAGDDFCDGGDGNDLIDGMDGNDVCTGGAGNDNVKGGGGNDHCDGGVGQNLIEGGQGTDTCGGGTVSDPDQPGGATPGDPNSFTATFANGKGRVFFTPGTTGTLDGAEFRIDAGPIPLNGKPNGNASVLVDGVFVSNMSLDGGGFGGFTAPFDDGTGAKSFPQNFPAIRDGSVVTVTLNGAEVLRTTLRRNGGTAGGGSAPITNTTLTATFANFGGNAFFQPGPGGTLEGARFEVVALNLPLNGAPNGTAQVSVNGVAIPLGVSLDAGGNGALRLPFAPDGGTPGFPANFPQVRSGAVVSVQLNGTEVRRATLS